MFVLISNSLLLGIYFAIKVKNYNVLKQYRSVVYPQIENSTSHFSFRGVFRGNLYFQTLSQNFSAFYSFNSNRHLAFSNCIPIFVNPDSANFLLRRYHSFIHSFIRLLCLLMNLYDCLLCTYTLLVTWDRRVKKMDLVLRHIAPTAE